MLVEYTLVSGKAFICQEEILTSIWQTHICPSPPGLEPTPAGLDSRCSNHCAMKAEIMKDIN